MHEYGPGAIGSSSRAPRLCHYSVIVHIMELFHCEGGLEQTSLDTVIMCYDIKLLLNYNLSQKLNNFTNRISF